jgi:actin-related protein
MKKSLNILTVLFLVCSTLLSCKSKAVFVETKTPDAVKDSTVLTSDKIIRSHYSNKVDFSTLYIRASAKYKHDDDSQTVSAEIKIKKDEQILVSIRVLGITMAKALITPKQVQYYEKLNGTYFDGDYAALSQWLGTDLDFNKIQNMLIGKPIDDLTKQKYTFTETDKFYQLNTTQNGTEKSFFFEAEHYLLKKQEISQPDKERSFEANYPNYQELSSSFLPASLTINAFQKKVKTTIIIDYNSITFNEELTFPYSVPEGYERIFIK